MSLDSTTGGAVVYRRAAGIDAIDEYSRRLVEAMRVVGVQASYHADGLTGLNGSARPWVLLQYNPFGYGPSGFAPGLIRDAGRLRRSGTPLAVMVHEAWVDIAGVKSAAVGGWQRAQLRALLRLADLVFTSTEAIADELGGGALHLPVASNITPVPASRAEARQHLHLDEKFTLGLFGRSNPSRALDYAEGAVAAVAELLGPDRCAVLNLGADSPPIHTPTGVEVRRPGPLEADEVSLHLLASDLVLLPFLDAMTTRRSTLMAALAHGRPVLGLSGRRTDALLRDARDALVLTPLGDRASYAAAAAELAGKRMRLAEIGAAGRSLYRSRFDWPVMANRVAAELGKLPRPRHRRRVVFVANDVGGPGGMERHTEQLISRLVRDGTEVTVVARTCELTPRAGLRFKRVPTPARPFAVAYPAFFVFGSVLAWRARGGLLHTTGAIVANRADVSTVHYCHHAARRRVAGSRASRPGTLYRANEMIAGFMSVAGEAWCYRPARTRLLCAVSDGVAGELRDAFPGMAAAVRAVPNGVDSDVFRPDARAREALRAELGIAADAPLALFVGGDWERKGLASAVSALAQAPEWQLAVAGNGHPGPLLELARRAGVEPRLRFLGTVVDMPSVYPAADAFVLPTSYEAFPLVTLEAAASALPLLVTRVNGVEEMMEEGSNGWFITRQAADIARRLNELSANRELADTMAAAARRTAVAYSWDAMADQYLELYAQLEHGRS